MNKPTLCRCPGCSRTFQANDSSYSATRVDHLGQAMCITDFKLCGRCSRHAEQQTHRGKRMVKRLLDHVAAYSPAEIHVVH